MDKLILTACICGAEVTKAQNPAVPYTVEEIAQEAKRAYDAGASIIHLHVRWDDGTPTQDKGRFAACFEAIRALCPDVIIQPSTGGAVGMTADERLQPLALLPEMATLDCGSVNFGGDEVFLNTETMIFTFAERMNAIGVKPEIEVFEKGMIDTAIRMLQKGQLIAPLHFDFVMGVRGGIGGELRDITFMRDSIPAGSTFTAAGVGRFQFPMVTAAMLMGGHARVGFEDNLYLSRGVLATSNGELVDKAVRIALELGRSIANPTEARAILSLPKR